MNIRCKTFANRSNQDIQFDQLVRTKPLTARPVSTPVHFSEPSPQTHVKSSTHLTQLSPRKRVNVVSFTPGSDGPELVTKSTIVSVPTTINTSDPYTSRSLDVGGLSAPILSSHRTTAPVPTSLGGPTVSTGRSSTQPLSQRSPIVVAHKLPSNIPHYNVNNPRLLSSTAISCVDPIPPNLTQPGSVLTTTSSSSIVRTVPSASPQQQTTKPTTRSASDLRVPPVPFTRSSSCAHSKTSTQHSITKPSVCRASSFPVQSTQPGLSIESGQQDASAKSQLVCGKKKRAAYNLRPWQQEIDPDEHSPTKHSRTDPIPTTQSQPMTTDLSRSHVVIPSTHPTRATNPSPSGGTAEPATHTQAKPSFDFPDSDTEDDVVVHTGGGLRYSSTNRTKLSRPNDTTAVLTSKLADELMNLAEDEDEEDEVKPWFCPDNRRVAPTSKCGTNTGSTLTTTTTTTNNRVQRTEKPLYAIVRQVSEAHVCQERGETQQLLDDVDYLVSGLRDENQATVRSLSVLTLANKCLTASFRYMLNAHGLLKRICANLHDAHKDYTLALTSAGLFYIISRDREPGIFDAKSLPVLVRLFQAPDTPSLDNFGGPQALARANKEADRVRTRVRQLLEELQQQRRQRERQHRKQDAVNGPNNLVPSPTTGKRVPLSQPASASLTAGTAGLKTRHLQMTRQLTTPDLVLESILNLGTRKAADWFKAQLRVAGGLDRVADAAIDAVDYLADLDPDDAYRRAGRHREVWHSSANPTGLDGFALDRLKRVCHYTKLLENMTYMNTDNQVYLVRYRELTLITRFVRCVRLCASRLPKHATMVSGTATSNGQSPHQSLPNDQSILVDCVLGIFRFLVNVSHNEFASDRLGACPGLLDTIVECVLGLPSRMPVQKRFDLLVLTLCLLANMCEHCPENRTRLVHLDIPRPHLKDSLSEDHDDQVNMDDEDEEEEEVIAKPVNGYRHKANLTSALDELIQLFLVREEQARNHDFERDDEAAAAAEARRREQAAQLIDSDNIGGPLCTGAGGKPTHIEEAGLKWRLIEDRKAPDMFGAGSRPYQDRGQSNKRQRMRRRRRRALARARRLKSPKRDATDDEDDDFVEEEDESSEDEDEDEELSDDSLDDEMEDDDDDDDSVGSGADVEFVADTQEEQEKLAERMSQAQQHMEDSVVAAYVALLLGCVLQSSRRYADKIRSKLPDGQFRPLAIMLAKLLSFLSLTKGVGSSGSETILRIVRILEAQDKPESERDVGIGALS